MVRHLLFLGRLLGWTLLLAGAGGAVAGAGGGFGARLDLFAHFAPVWCALVLVGLVLLRALRPGRVGRAAAAVAAAGLAGFALVAWPEFAGALRVREAPPGADDFRVLQFNVWADNLDPWRSATVALEADPDVIVVQEGLRWGDEVFELLRRTYPYGSRSDQPNAARILSKRPGEHEQIDEPALTVARFRTVTAGGRPVTVMGVHYKWPDPVNRQALQRTTLAEVAARQTGDLVLTGDFNLTPWSAAMRSQDRSLALSGLERRTRAVFSWPARVTPRRLRWFPFPFLPIDQVYATRSWRTVEVRRLERTGSDHYPVLTVLSPPSP